MKIKHIAILALLSVVSSGILIAESFVKPKKNVHKRVSHSEMCGAVGGDLIDLNVASNALIRELSLFNDDIGKQGSLLISDAKESEIGKASVAELQQHDSTLQGMYQRIQAMRQEVSSMRHQVRKGPRLEDPTEKNKK